jgi:hypothetical protein
MGIIEIDVNVNVNARKYASNRLEKGSALPPDGMERVCSRVASCQKDSWWNQSLFCYYCKQEIY